MSLSLKIGRASGVPAEIPLCVPWKAVTICTIAVTTFSDLAEHCEFEEVAHLPIHGKLPTRDES